MLSKDQARTLLANHLGDRFVILDDDTIERDWGWVFFHQAKRFEDTRFGCSSYMVNRFDGSIQGTDSNYPVECHIRRYERQLTREAEDFGDNLSAWFDHVRFDTTRYVYKKETNRGPYDCKRHWLTPDDDAIELGFIALPPNLPARAHSSAQIEELYRKRLDGLGQILEFRLVTLDEMDCIWMILNMSPQSESDIYCGWLTIPFADFSFELKIVTQGAGPIRSPEPCRECAKSMNPFDFHSELITGLKIKNALSCQPKPLNELGGANGGGRRRFANSRTCRHRSPVRSVA